jgi:hypothetical protein
MQHRRIFLVFAATVLVSVSASTAFAAPYEISTSYAQRKVISGKFPIHSACMMPPQGILTKLRVGLFNKITTTEMPQESEAWTKDIEAMVESHLTARSISIQSAANPLSSGASADDINAVISQIQQKFKTVSTLMNDKPRDITKSAYTLGDQVGMLPCSENSDILVFVRSAGQIVPGGSNIPDLANLSVTMADAKTGEILDLIRLYPGGNFPAPAEVYFGADFDIELASKNIGSIPKKTKKSGQ